MGRKLGGSKQSMREPCLSRVPSSRAYEEREHHRRHFFVAVDFGDPQSDSESDDDDALNAMLQARDFENFIFDERDAGTTLEELGQKLSLFADEGRVQQAWISSNKGKQACLPSPEL